MQSFDPDEIRTLGRKHHRRNGRRRRRAPRSARESTPFRSTSCSAFRGKRPGAGEQSLDAAPCAGESIISPRTASRSKKGRRTPPGSAREPAAFFDDEREAELYAIAIETLEGAGFEQYEISNFARPGHRCAHNCNYWANGEYVGLGVGAASYCDGTRSVHTRSLEEYVAAALEGGAIPADAERLDGRRRVGEAVMLALRTAQGVGLSRFQRTLWHRRYCRLRSRRTSILTGTGLLERHGRQRAVDAAEVDFLPTMCAEPS